MKKILMIVLIAVVAVGLLACNSSTPAESSEAASSEAPASSEAAASESAPESAEPEILTLDIGMYADGADSYYQVLHDTLQACADADPTCDWTVNYKVGQNTAAEQLQAVEDFITAGYDAIVVIQNSVDTTSECIAKCVDAGIPYFGATHSFVAAPNASDAAGSVCYNFVEEGYSPR